MGKRRHNLAVAVAGVAAVVAAAAVFAWAHADPYPREMRPVYAVIARGEQCWADDAGRMLDRIVARSSDPHALAERLLAEPDGSLAAEGMFLAVRSRHPQAQRLVRQHSGDRRWNWYLANNDELARQLLAQLDGRPVENWVATRLARPAAG